MYVPVWHSIFPQLESIWRQCALAINVSCCCRILRFPTGDQCRSDAIRLQRTCSSDCKRRGIEEDDDPFVEIVTNVLGGGVRRVRGYGHARRFKTPEIPGPLAGSRCSVGGRDRCPRPLWALIKSHRGASSKQAVSTFHGPASFASSIFGG